MISCTDRSAIECNESIVLGSSFSYTVKDFQSFGESLKSKEISKTNLICKFKSKFDSTSTGDTTIFQFILWMYPETIDTCWGFLEYKETEKVVKDYSVICQ